MDAPLENMFRYETAIPYEPHITRRDPSPVIRRQNTYFVWYSKSRQDASGYAATIWYATSEDGRQWRERGQALAGGAPGTWDEHAVFTPTILSALGQYYLFYTAVPEPFDNDGGGPHATPTAIGVAMAESPHGPWQRFPGNPVLRPGCGNAFDSHRVDDACLLVRAGRYWLYYKGRAAGLSPGETKMGLALADHPTGPYEKSAANPLINGGHEVCVFPCGPGVAALVSPLGPAGRSLQYATDGVHFTKICTTTPPAAPGPYREDNYQEGYGPGITWGLCHCENVGLRPYLLRFECDLRPGEFHLPR